MARAVGTVVERLNDMARSLVAGRRVILAGFPVAATPPIVTKLRSSGAERCFVLGPLVGTGDLPDPGDADWFSL